MADTQPDAQWSGRSTDVDAEGDRAALVENLIGFQPLLLGTARMLVPGDSNARDLAQATLEIAVRRLHTLRQPDRLRSWLLAIEVREAVRLKRRLSLWISLDSEGIRVPTSAGPDDVSLALRVELMRLTPRVRSAVVLHYMVGLSIAETADAMGVTQNTVKSQLAAGLHNLRKVLERIRLTRPTTLLWTGCETHTRRH